MDPVARVWTGAILALMLTVGMAATVEMREALMRRPVPPIIRLPLLLQLRQRRVEPGVRVASVGMPPVRELRVPVATAVRVVMPACPPPSITVVAVQQPLRQRLEAVPVVLEVMRVSAVPAAAMAVPVARRQ